MPKKLHLAPTIHTEKIRTVNFGTNAQKFTSAEIGKAVKLIGPDTYGLCAEGDKIEGIIDSSDWSLYGATRGGFSTGGIRCSGYVEVVATTALTFGALVAAGIQPVLGTQIVGLGQGDIPATPVKLAPLAEGPFLMRIVGFGPVGTGDAGTVCVAEFIN